MTQTHLIRTGVETKNKCAAGINVRQKNLTGKKMRIVSVKVPSVPIIAALPAAVVSGNTFDLPAIHSMSELVNFFDFMIVGGSRIAHAYYSNNEFELCSVTALNLHAILQLLLKLPATIPAGTCWSSHVDPSTWAPVHRGYSIQMIGSGTDGIRTDLTNVLAAETVAVLGPTADCSQTPWLRFKQPPQGFYFSAYYRNFDETLPLDPIDLADTDTFEVAIEVAN